MVLSGCSMFSGVLYGCHGFSVCSRRFSVVFVDAQWFSVGSQWFLMVLVASQCFSVVLTGSGRFSYVLSGFRRFSEFS